MTRKSLKFFKAMAVMPGLIGPLQVPDGEADLVGALVGQGMIALDAGDIRDSEEMFRQAGFLLERAMTEDGYQVATIRLVGPKGDAAKYAAMIMTTRNQILKCESPEDGRAIVCFRGSIPTKFPQFGRH